MPVQNKLELLDPRMEKCVRKLTEIVPIKMLGYTVYVNETLREPAVQMAYYSRGRVVAWLVKLYFKFCKLWDITDEECLKLNTKTLDSKHLKGQAADIYLMKDGKILWEATPEEWEKLYAIAENECGLDACAGGKYNSWKWDMPHFEFRTEV